MRLLVRNGNKLAVTEGGYLYIRELHGAEWRTVFSIELVKLAEAYAEYQDWMDEH